jgi:hypothetical protein
MSQSFTVGLLAMVARAQYVCWIPLLAWMFVPPWRTISVMSSDFLPKCEGPRGSLRSSLGLVRVDQTRVTLLPIFCCIRLSPLA